MHGDAHSPFLAVGPVGPALKICARWNSQIHRLAGVGLDHNVISNTLDFAKASAMSAVPPSFSAKHLQPGC